MKLFVLFSFFCFALSNAGNNDVESKKSNSEIVLNLEYREADSNRFFLFCLSSGCRLENFLPKILSLEPTSFIKVFDDLLCLLFMNEGIFEPRVFKNLSTIKKLYQVSFTPRFSSQFSQLPENPLMQKSVALSIISSRLKELASEAGFSIDESIDIDPNCKGDFTKLMNFYKIENGSTHSYFLFLSLFWQRLIGTGFHDKKGTFIPNNRRNILELKKKYSKLGAHIYHSDAYIYFFEEQGIMQRILFLKEEDGFGVEGFKIFIQIMFGIDSAIMEALKGKDDLSWSALRSISDVFDSTTTTVSSMVNFMAGNREYDHLPQQDDEEGFEPVELPFVVNNKKKAMLALIKRIYGKKEYAKQATSLSEAFHEGKKKQ